MKELPGIPVEIVQAFLVSLVVFVLVPNLLVAAWIVLNRERDRLWFSYWVECYPGVLPWAYLQLKAVERWAGRRSGP